MDNMAFCLQALYINGHFVNVCFLFWIFIFLQNVVVMGGGAATLTVPGNVQMTMKAQML